MTKKNCVGDLWLEYLSHHQEVVQLSEEIVLDSVLAAAESIVLSIQEGKKLILFGNGGSAADAQHIAAEFVGRFNVDRRALNAVALTSNVSIITAVANDYETSYIFSRQISAMGQKGDIAIGLSTSGKSENVLLGLNEAKRLGLKTIMLSGADCDKCSADISIIVPSRITSHIQEMHLIIGHFFAGYVEKALFLS